MHPSEVIRVPRYPKACDAITFWGGISSRRELLRFYLILLNSTPLRGDISGEVLGFAIRPVKGKGKKNAESYQEGPKTRGCSHAWGKAAKEKWERAALSRGDLTATRIPALPCGFPRKRAGNGPQAWQRGFSGGKTICCKALKLLPIFFWRCFSC